MWIETDENGEDHRYLGWGNQRFFVCELNEDMISVKDRDGNPDNLSVGYSDEGTFDIVLGQVDGNKVAADKKVWVAPGLQYTEAPYYYRQQDENGNYYGPYYLFFACDWREQMAYATTDDIMSNDWTFGGVLMEPSATANTNHMAVFDFKGQTYFVYHDGSLPHGSGYRRVACVEPFSINKDGSIDPIKKTATGLTGTASQITDLDGNYVAYIPFVNITSDSFYPITGKPMAMNFFAGDESSWEINPGKADETKAEYVSIESNNKPGLYITANNPSNGISTVSLSQDVNGSEAEAASMTFRTLEGFAGCGVTFESVAYPGYYLVSRNGALSIVQNPEAEEATFVVSTDVTVAEGTVNKTTRFYKQNDGLNTDDIRIILRLENGKTVKVDEYTTDADEIDMSTLGEKTLKVTFEYDGEEYEGNVIINVVEPEYFGN